jgi:hypothetical protein
MNFNSGMALEQLVQDPTAFFEGRVEAHGFVCDWKGRLRRQFSAIFDGHSDERGISINEVLTYTDGGVDHRTWRIEPNGADGFTARADGVIGVADIRRVRPTETRWTYQMDLPINGRNMRFAFEDIMVQVDADTIVVDTPIRKFGLRVAGITTIYKRVAARG